MEPAPALPDRTHAFERQRKRLFGLAYRMLGTLEEAEDVVQESYLRWHQADTSAIDSAEAWLFAVATRLSIDRLRRAKTERLAYHGSWLPEPIATDERSAPDRRVERTRDLSIAFLMLLERLGPEERAAFVLREVFEKDYAEIATALDKSEPATRQMLHRAHERLGSDRQRFQVDADAQRRLLERFVVAMQSADSRALLAVLAPEVTYTSDGGGKVPAAPRVLYGAERIAHLVLTVERKTGAELEHCLVELNGVPALVTRSRQDGRPLSTTSIACDGERIVAFYRTLSPDKLGGVGSG